MKLKSILEDIEVLKPRRSSEERQKNYAIVLQKQIQNYIKNGCEGNLDLQNAPFKRFPSNLTKIGGHLILNDSQIEELPNNLVVDKHLSFSKGKIKKLPENLSVGGILWLVDSLVEELPDDLKVGKDLNLDRTRINKLPDNLTVNGYLSMDKCPIKTLPKNLRIYGDFSLNRSLIEILPDDLFVRGNIWLLDTSVSKKYSKAAIRRMIPRCKGRLFL